MDIEHIYGPLSEFFNTNFLQKRITDANSYRKIVAREVTYWCFFGSYLSKKKCFFGSQNSGMSSWCRMKQTRTWIIEGERREEDEAKQEREKRRKKRGKDRKKGDKPRDEIVEESIV